MIHIRFRLSEQQRKAIESQDGRGVEVVDSATKRIYILAVAKTRTQSPEPLQGVSPGIRRSQEAFWRELPELLKKKANHGKWVAYHGEERIGIAATEADLLRIRRRRGLADDAYYTDVIVPYDRPPWKPETIDPSLSEFHDLPRNSS